jgi:hypothetical protein
LGGSPSLDQRQYSGLDGGSGDAGLTESVRCQTLRSVEEPEKDVFGTHESVPEAMGLFLRLRKDCSCAIGESFEPRDVEGESLVGRLLADTEGTAYVRPRATAAPALVNEVSKECVGGLFEIDRGLRGLRQLRERILIWCIGANVVDEFLQSGRWSHSSTIR